MSVSPPPSGFILRKRAHLTALFDRMGYRIGAEVGVCEGIFSAHILAHSKVRLLYSIDPWLDTQGKFVTSVHEACRRRLDPFGTRSQIIVGTSPKAAHRFADGSLDFVYLDGDHSYAGVTADLEAWHAKVRAGGLLAGHDYKNRGLNISRLMTVPGDTRGANEVRKAVDDYVAAHGLDLHTTTREKCPSWYIWTTGSPLPAAA
jgi:predicted O-methyltransferase YrrM